MTKSPARGDDALRVWLRLLSCANLIERRVREALRTEFGSTLPRFDLLAQLEHAREQGMPHLSMSELSRRLMVTNGNVTGLAARLEREGLLRRSPSPEDRRQQRVTLTRAGRDALDRMAQPHRTWIDDLFSALRPAERRQLYRLLGTLKDAAESAHPNGHSSSARGRVSRAPRP